MTESLSRSELVEAVHGGHLGTLVSVCLHSESETSAESLLSGRDLQAISLHFTGARVTLLCLGETDEFSIVTCVPLWLTQQTGLHQGEPWAEAVGLELFNYDESSNAAGYQDIVQFRFGDPGKGERVRIQLEAVASRIRVYRVRLNEGSV